ncbi:MAG: hypothetical protein AB2A00_01405 [Myxococcota bacterium]
MRGERPALLADISFGTAAALALVGAAAVVAAFWPYGLWPMTSED